MKKILLIAVVIIGSFMAANAQITLSFNPAKGSTYQYTLDMTQKIKQNLMGQNIDMNQNMRTVYDMHIIENNSKEIKASFTYRTVFYEMINPMMNMKYDSNGSNENTTGIDGIMAKIFGSLINKSFDITILSDGTVSSVNGMDAIVEDMMTAIGSDMMSQQVAAGMKEQFSNEAMRTTFEQSFKIYPTSKIKPGESWTVDQETTSGGMDMLINTTYTLKSVTNNKATIVVASNISGMDGQLKGTQNGEMILDATTGMQDNSKMTQNIEGNISANGMEVGMNIESLITVSTEKK